MKRTPGRGSFTGAAGGAACGDLARISLADRRRQDRVASPSTPKAAPRPGPPVPASARWSTGETVLDAARIGPDDIEEELGGLSPARRHAAMLDRRRTPPGALRRGFFRRWSWPSRARTGCWSPVSGGVDSAVAALRERERGAEVVAVTVKLWADPDTDGTKACCSPEAVLGARAVTHSTRHSRTSPSTSRTSSANGWSASSSRDTAKAAPRTPACSATAKSGSRRWSTWPTGWARPTWSPATTPGSSRTEAVPCSPPEATTHKDQSYMLAALPPEVIARLSFPLAEISKTEVREIAERELALGGEEAGEPGPLLPRRSEQEGLPASGTAV